jgi:molybdopterin-guanine dinucleotide biosynthesis protein A
MSATPQNKISGVILTNQTKIREAEHPRLLGGLLRTLTPFVDDLIVVAGNPQESLGLNALLVKNLTKQPGELSGLYTGLFYARHSHALAVSLEQPLPRSTVLQVMLERWEPRWDMVVPAPAGNPRPFPAIYAKACINRIEHLLSNNRQAVDPLFKKSRMRIVSEKVLRQNDPQLISFLKLTLPRDAARIRTLLAGDGH